MLCSTGSIALLYGKHCFVPVEAMTYITVVLCCVVIVGNGTA